MKLKILCFGITKDIVGSFEYHLEIEDLATVATIKHQLGVLFPAFSNLKSLRMAVNSEYASDELILKENDEIVLIPPVSGG